MEGGRLVAEGWGRDSKSGKGSGDDDPSWLTGECGRRGRDDRMPLAAVAGDEGDVSAGGERFSKGGVLEMA